MTYLLALDEGTTSARALVFDLDGNIVSFAQKEFTQSFPRSGWVEHDAEEIWSAQVGVAVEALSRAKLRPRDISALGITDQRETVVLWDRKTGRPVAPAIVWQDRRTAGVCDRLRAAGHERLIQERTGLLLDAYFSGTKIAWLLDHVDGARRRAEAGELAIGTIDSWLVWNLTGGQLHITEPSNASRTMLFDIRRGDWDDDLLELLNVPRAILPEVRSSSEVYGQATASGLDGIPIAGIAGDQQSALFGQLCVEPGLAKNTYGTGCFLLQNTGNEPAVSTNRLLSTVAWKIDGKTTYALEGSVFVAGAVVQWLRDGLKLIRSAEEVNDLAATVPDNGGVYLVPAFTGLGAPHWDPYARGTIVGLSRGSTGGHIARAALESIAFQTADLIDAMRADAAEPLVELRVDGGASQSDLLMQAQADLLGIPVVRPIVTETTALGAAYLAGLGVGAFAEGHGPFHAEPRIERRFEPGGDVQRMAISRATWTRAVERAKGWETP